MGAEQTIELTGQEALQQLFERVTALENEMQALKERTEAVDQLADERLAKISAGIDELKRMFRRPSASPVLN
jgi:hypothetical protein